MVSYFSEEHRIFRESIRAFVAKEIVSFVDKWEKERTIPRELFEACGRMGFSG